MEILVFRNVVRFTVVPVLFAGLVACGGGGKSSSGSSSSAVVFRGSETVSISTPGVQGVADDSYTGALTISVNGGAAVVTDADGFEFRGRVKGATFNARGIIPAGRVSPGVTCSQINVTYQGTIGGGTASGTSAGTFTCSGLSRTIGFRLSGKFTTTRNARLARASVDRRGFLHQVVGRLFR